ncbi:interferon alpha/beta receptor 2 [Calypte anna]|uniref:interferon alpha/beta receptor 2 n=1 Tax=Calypte anna TaxID=9244 RepID=UPI0011C45574|nr:interferon alpha/beta receptor 2 [Calypte anna]XP_030325050.1 interferon alpha/beta receptor 2 [Calypte anna]XP_030325052.1 interferon alpha/beta receptor 2 [Calypte anna]XP_030325053.1 interferon alpha/beta receptor 2 [Calypte anna]
MDGPMHFYQLVYISVLSTACCSLPGRFLGGPPYNLRMESYNFHHILSWQTKTNTAVPSYYRVLYTDHRTWKTAKQCSNITQLSCNLTDDFEDTSSPYSALVQSFTGTEVFNSSVLHFVPRTDTILGPPEVRISSCLNCINVSIKLPTSHFRKNGKLLTLIDIYKELYYDITLKTVDGEHRRSREKTTQENFNTVIEELYPNRNYCVSVMVTASLNKHSIPSAWKCITTDSVAQQDYHAVLVAVTAAICFILMLAGALKCIHAGGYILQKTPLPLSLVSIITSVYPFWTPEPVDTASVEVIYKEIKKRANESSGRISNEDDSNEDDSDDISNHDYTRRNIISRDPHSSDVPNGFIQYSIKRACDDSSSQASENPSADPEDFEDHEMGIEEGKDASSELFNPLSEVNCNYSSRQRNSACFAINLNTVLLGASEENVDSSVALVSSQEDALDWQCAYACEAKVLGDTESVWKPPCQNGSHEWQNSDSSDESNSSDSDTDPKSGYIRR